VLLNADWLHRSIIKTMGAASFTNIAAEEKKARELARKHVKEAEKPNKWTKMA
jgi:hypothetical protein